MADKKDIAVITVARSDFGRLLPSLRLIKEDPRYRLRLIVTGNHCQSEFGNSVEEIEEYGFDAAAVINPGNGNECQKASRILKGCGNWFLENSPSFTVILGDRYEMLAAAQASVMARVPIIHIGGGYQTAGAMDDKIRKSITALSDYHIVASDKCFDRVHATGVGKKYLHKFGAPDLEILNEVEALTKDEFCKDLGLNPEREFCLVTFHPETGANFDDNREYMQTAARFLRSIDEQILITAPCADPGAFHVFSLINELKKHKPDTIFVENLGIHRYVNAMHHALCMIGNSSSGIIESATLKLPVLNIGNRQGGRQQSGNVINSAFDLQDIKSGYTLAVSDAFKERCQTINNVYGDGHFSERFIKLLKRICW